MTMSAAEWRRFYAAERASLGEAGLAALLERAPRVALPAGGALVFPHTRLSSSGELVAAVAAAVVASGADTVLALGVLHGAREADAAVVGRARAGDRDALDALRRVHGPGVSGDGGRWSEEFSLDGFTALIDLAARRAGARPPRVVARYPFFSGQDPASLPGMDELHAVAGRAALVATTDPVHHGVGYGTPAGEAKDEREAATRDAARGWVEAQLAALASADYGGFARACAEHRSDFRDVGPALACILHATGGWRPALRELVLVDYSDVLRTPRPTWVAGALVTCAAAG